MIGYFIATTDFIMTSLGTLAVAALTAIVALLWRIRDQVATVDGRMALVEQKIEAGTKESNLRFMMVDQKFSAMDQKFTELTKEVERQGAMIEEQRRWRWENGVHQEEVKEN